MKYGVQEILLPRPGVLLLPKVLICHRGHKENAVLGPLLNAGQMEQTIAASTAPYLGEMTDTSVTCQAGLRGNDTAA